MGDRPGRRPHLGRTAMGGQQAARRGQRRHCDGSAGPGPALVLRAVFRLRRVGRQPGAAGDGSVQRDHQPARRPHPDARVVVELRRVAGRHGQPHRGDRPAPLGRPDLDVELRGQPGDARRQPISTRAFGCPARTICFHPTWRVGCSARPLRTRCSACRQPGWPVTMRPGCDSARKSPRSTIDRVDVWALASGLPVRVAVYGKGSAPPS